MSDYLAVRHLEDGRILCVVPLLFGRARLLISRGWLTADDEY